MSNRITEMNQINVVKKNKSMASNFFHDMDDLDTMAAGSYYKSTVTDTMATENAFLNKEEDEEPQYQVAYEQSPKSVPQQEEYEDEYEYYEDETAAIAPIVQVDVLEDNHHNHNHNHQLKANNNKTQVRVDSASNSHVNQNEQQQPEEEEDEEEEEEVHVDIPVKQLDPGYDQVLSGPSLRNLNQSDSSYSSDDPSSDDDSSYAT